ncbi:MAG: hypothetical protein QOG41_2413 [Thermoleophilaceae bacterium]|nr:hypothetical protein [Thermoleophilaceae bacterium]
MTRDEQLTWERQAARPASAAAFASAVAGLASLVVANAGTGGRSSDAVDALAIAHKHATGIVAAGVLSAISILLVIPVLLFLFRATQYRRPQIPSATRHLVTIGPPLFAIGLIAQSIALKRAVDRAYEKLPLAPKAAKNLAEDAFTTGAVGSWSLLLLGVGILVGGGVILISLNARRAGLLSAFMGITGAIVGGLVVLPFFGRPPIIYFFWIAVVGLILVDRLPGQRSRGPAWESGEAEPWPTAAEIRAEQLAARGEDPPSRRGRVRDPEPEPEDDYEDEYEDDDVSAPAPHPRSKKRKRKRRR